MENSIWKFLKGYVNIYVEGRFSERFVNICVNRDIKLKDIKIKRDNRIYFKIVPEDFKKLKDIYEKTGCKPNIVKKSGPLFTLKRYKKRKLIPIGFLVALAIFIFLLSFIWEVEIKGNEKVTSEEIIATLEDIGIKPGIFKTGIDTKNAVFSLMLEYPQLSWAEVSIKGTKLFVDLAESVEKPVMVEKNLPCDIIADKDGIIKDIYVKSGKALVKSGDTVLKGQILVSGVIGKDERMKTVHSIADIKIRKWYEYNCNYNLKKIIRTDTGEKVKEYYFQFFGKRQKIWPSENKFETFEIKEDLKIFRIGNNFPLPFGIAVVEYNEIKEEKIDITKEEAEKNAMESSMRAIKEDRLKDKEIKSINGRTVQNEDGGFVLNIVVECVESIGTQQIIKEKILEE